MSCSESVVYFKFLTVLIFNTCTTCWYVNLSKNYCLSFDCGCKGKDFILTAKFFRRKIQSFFWATATVGILLRTSNLIPFPQVTSFIILVRRSLLNAGAKVVLYNIQSKLFILYFSFIFPPEKLLYNVRTKKPEKIFLANRYNPHLSILTYVYFGRLSTYFRTGQPIHSFVQYISNEWNSIIKRMKHICVLCVWYISNE